MYHFCVLPRLSLQSVLDKFLPYDNTGNTPSVYCDHRYEDISRLYKQPGLPLYPFSLENQSKRVRRLRTAKSGVITEMMTLGVRLLLLTAISFGVGRSQDQGGPHRNLMQFVYEC